MYKYTPPRINKAGLVIPLFLFAAAALSLLFTAAGIGNRMVLQLTAVICLTAGIQITTRYLLCGFTYIISERNAAGDADWDAVGSSYGPETGTLSLSVIRTQWKCSRTLAVMPLSDITDVVNTRAEAVKKHPDIRNYVSFCVNMFPKNAWVVIFEQEGIKTAVSLEPDDTILGYIIKHRRPGV